MVSFEQPAPGEVGENLTIGGRKIPFSCRILFPYLVAYTPIGGGGGGDKMAIFGHVHRIELVQ